MRFVLALVVAQLGGCVETAVQDCGSLVCDPGLVCVPERGACHSADDVAACDGRGQGDTCVGSTGEGVCDRGVCGVSPCGDGVLDPSLGEVCDDGNVFDGDGCDSTCRSARCLAIPDAAGELARSISSVLEDPSCREVYVSPGTFFENLIVSRDVDIVGADLMPSIIDGSELGPVLDITDQSVTLERITVTHGSGVCGGGIVSTNSDLLLIGTIIEANQANNGAGLCQTGGSVILSESEVRDNLATAGSTRGGAVSVIDGALIVRNQTRLTGNRALGTNTARGGAIFALTSSVSLTGDCVLDDNGASPDDRSLFAFMAGGAVALDQSDLSVTNCTLSNNFAGGAGSTGSAFGGAVYGAGRTYGGVIAPLASLNRETVLSNNVAQASASAFGGGVFMAAGNVTFNQARVDGNSAIGSPARGGGLAVDSVQPAVVSTSATTFSANTASSATTVAAGGAIWIDAAPTAVNMFIRSTTIAGNDASSTAVPSQGGGLFISGIDLSGQITNSTITGNKAASGGGIMTSMLSGLSLTMINITATNNSAGGIDFASVLVQARNINLTDSIVFGNGAPECAIGADGVGGDFNILGDLATCVITGATSSSDVDPVLGPLADNGGPTETHAPTDPGAAMGGGDPGGCSVAVDQRGFTREGTACTVGAVNTAARPPAD